MEETNSRCSAPACSSSHQGKLIINEVFAINIDRLFEQIFTSSQFLHHFHNLKGSTDLTITEWNNTSDSNSKTRDVNFIMALHQALGPKTSTVQEIQTLLPCSVAGQLYAIDIDTGNKNIPYDDNFHVLGHFCLQRLSNTQTSFAVFAEIKYKKSTWAVVRSLIERNTMEGMVDFYGSMVSELHSSSKSSLGSTERQNLRKRRRDQRIESLNKKDSKGPNVSNINNGTQKFVYIVLLLLFLLNVCLLYYLTSIEESLEQSASRKEEKLKYLQKQERVEPIVRQHLWDDTLEASFKMINELENALINLREKIGSEGKLMSHATG